VNLTFTDEQGLLADTAAAFTARGRHRDSEDDPAVWRAMADLGWAGLVLPEEHGGAGQGLTEMVVLCEQLGRGPVVSPLVVSGTLAALPICWAASPEQQQRWLPSLARGEHIGSLALFEPGMHDEWGPVSMAGSDTLSGTKTLVPWAGTADVLLVATTDGLRIVDRSGPGVRVTPHDALGGEPLATVTLDGAPGEPLGDSGRDRGLLDRALDHAAIAQLAYAVGGAEQALDTTVRYARDRHQFGRPIGSFQAVAHRCADMRTDVDACRYLAYQAAWALDRDGPADMEVAAAKSFANDALRRVFRHAHQVHGAIGFSTEYDLHLFTRRAKAFELSYGSSARHRERLAATMGLAAAEGASG
jgi:alkylation response protein AidB-like acyl-CoA dehydrogenase